MKDFIIANSTVHFSTWFPEPSDNCEGIVIGSRKYKEKWDNKIFLDITARNITLHKKTNLYEGIRFYITKENVSKVYKMLYHQVKPFDLILKGKKVYVYKKQSSKIKLIAKLLKMSEKDISEVWNDD